MMSGSEWAAVLCDWELREAQIEALIDEGCITDFEDVPDAGNLRLRVIAGMGKSRVVLTPLQSWWRNTPREKVWGEGAVSIVTETNFFGMGVTTARGYIDVYRRLYGIQLEAPGEPCYPLGSSPEDIEKLREALKQPSGQLPGMSSDPASVNAPLKEIRSKAKLTR